MQESNLLGSKVASKGVGEFFEELGDLLEDARVEVAGFVGLVRLQHPFLFDEPREHSFGLCEGARVLEALQERAPEFDGGLGGEDGSPGVDVAKGRRGLKEVWGLKRCVIGGKVEGNE